MIDIPVLVKDALKNGDLKKNYRFVLGEEDWHEVGSIKTIGWYTPSTSYGDDKKYTIRDSKIYRFIVDDADHDTYALYIYKGNDPNWRTVEATSRNTWDITLTDAAYAYVEIKSSSGNYYSPVSVQNFFAYTIDNNNLVSESVSIDERMCSGDTLKFGLCEGSSLEFQYFDFPNITGQRIQAFVDVESEEMEYSKIYELKHSTYYSLPADGRYKITATSENMANIEFLLFVHGTTTTRMEFTVAQDGHGEIEIPNAQKGDGIYLNYRSGTTPTAEVFQWVHKWHTIPMGFFDVKKCSRQASTGIIKVTAYNKLQSDYLDAKAVDQIVELIGEGEDNSSDVSIHKILTTLLEDYSIEPLIASTPKFEYTSSSYYARSVQVTWRNKSTPNVDGGYGTFSSAIDVFNVTLQGVNRNDGNYYYAKLLKAFGNKIQEAFDSIINQINSGYYDYYIVSGGGIVYTNLIDVLNNTVHIDNNDWKDLKGRATFKYYSSPYTVVKDYININEMVDDITSDIYLYDTIELDLYIPRNFELAHNTSGRKAYASTGISYSESVMPYLVTLSAIEKMRITESQAEAFYDVTLRDLQSAAYEVNCKFGKLDRITDLFSGVELNHSRLYPAEDLYPADSLYPDGAAASANKSMYSQLWADEGNVHKWRYLIITYKGLDENNNEADFTLQRTVNADGSDDYNMSDNWLFRNLIWTAADVGDYADAMVAKMQDVTWFPFEMWLPGLPYLETGDEIEIPLGENSYTSYILQRQLKGIQNLQDTYINGTLDIF